jgi:hypothetical protein
MNKVVSKLEFARYTTLENIHLKHIRARQKGQREITSIREQHNKI